MTNFNSILLVSLTEYENFRNVSDTSYLAYFHAKLAQKMLFYTKIFMFLELVFFSPVLISKPKVLVSLLVSFSLLLRTMWCSSSVHVLH